MMRTHRRALAFLAALAVATLGAFAADAAPKEGAAPKAPSTQTSTATAPLPRGISHVTSVEGIDEYRLANGLRVLLFPDMSKQTATVNVTYLVGSRHENYGETGMAHLLEHLVFKGTPRHQNIPDELTKHGCRPNGSTWFDRTNYFETFAASEDNLAWALDLEADRMVNSYIAKKDLDSEMTVVRNEFEIGENSPQGVLMERVLSTAYLWHNYGKSTIGCRADLENVPIDRLQAFYRNWYQPDNAVLVVAGNFDTSKTLGMIQKTFGKIEKPKRVLPVTYTAEPTQDGERSATLRRVGDTQAVGVAFHIPPAAHEDYPALDVLSFVLGDDPSGRLYKALVETKKAAAARSFAMPLHEPGFLYASADVRLEQSLDEVRDTMVEVTDAVVKNPPTAAEVDRARVALAKTWEITFRNSERVAIELSEWSALGDWRLMFLYRDRLSAVTPADVARVAAAYLKPSNRTVGLYVPTKAPDRSTVPPPPDVAALVGSYTGGAALAAGEEVDVTPEAIEALAMRVTLPSGAKVVFVPKKTRAGTVNVALTLHLGDEASLRGKSTVGQLTGQMLMRGTTKRTRQEIADEIDRLKAQVAVFGGATGAFGSIESTRENVAASTRLLAEMLRSPSFPAAELDLLKQETLADIEDSKSNPFQMASTAWNRHMKPWPREDVRYVSTPEEDIQDVNAATLEQIKAFHADYYGASAAEIAVVGDFDPNEMTGLLKELFGDWKSKRAFARIATTYREQPPIDESLEAPDKESAMVLAGCAVDMRDDDPEYPAMVLGNFMTGGGFLNSRLATRLRQKEGLSYRVGSRFEASSFDKDGWFTATAMCAPQNAEKAEVGFREEIAKVLEGGFAADEIEEAKSGWLQSRRVSRGSDRDLARTLAMREFAGRTLAWDGAFESRVAALGAGEIAAAMRRHIDPSKISIVMAGDFAMWREGGAAAQAAR
jgi:zinc protease